MISDETGYWLLKLDQIARDADAEKLGRAQMHREAYIHQEADRRALEASKNVLAAVKGGKSLEEALNAHLDELERERAARAGDEKKPDRRRGRQEGQGDAERQEDPGDRAPLTIRNHPARPIPDATLPFNVNGDPISGVKQGADLAKTAFALDKPGDTPSDVTAFDTGYLVSSSRRRPPPPRTSGRRTSSSTSGRCARRRRTTRSSSTRSGSCRSSRAR